MRESKKTNKDKQSSTKDSKKNKKGKSDGGAKKAAVTVLLNPQQAMKIIQNSKVITMQDLARQTGVKISTANVFLREAAKNNTIKQVGGYSGHYLYQMTPS